MNMESYRTLTWELFKRRDYEQFSRLSAGLSAQKGIYIFIYIPIFFFLLKRTLIISEHRR